MYTPLNVKSNYSLLSSLLKIDDIIEYSKSHNLSSAVLCDNSMFGVCEFYHKCRNNNIKPVIGLEVKYGDNYICLYAKNYDGYKSLIKICTIQNEKDVVREDLEKYNNSLICILPFKYMDIYEDIKDIYDELFIGYSNKSEESDAYLIDKNIVFFKETLYKEKSDSKLLDFIYRIRDGKSISDDVSYDVLNKEINIDAVMESSDIGIMNIEKIISRCNFEFPKTKLLLPKFSLDEGVSAEEYLYKLSFAGLSKRLGGNVSKKYKDRLLYELGVIKEMGFANYFLVVYDFIFYAKKNNILIGPGRGSAAGSLVSYSIGITDIDPIKYNLLFERFLNPERVTMPDIDTDFPDDKRSEVIDYVVSKYGKKNVAGIVTFGTLGAKQVLRDVGRVLNIPIYKIDRACKFIPSFTHQSLEEILGENKNFKAIIESDNQLKEVFSISVRLEGFPRHTSSHAAGIVMSSVELDEVVPLVYNDGMYQTSYSMEYLEELGLLKMDFLGLKNLSLIANILDDIEKNYGKRISFSDIPLDDEKTIEVFARADTTGIFQFESSGMRNFLSRLKPDSFEDIFAAIALFRPGAAPNIDPFIRRKHKEEKISYLDPSLEDITKDTYGILIYQEQIMQVANIFAGYTLGEADILRRAMSKKKFDLLKNEEDKFIKRSIERGHDRALSKKIFDLILNFAGYGFNRSHSVAYSLIAYKMAYLKVRYKHEFYSNLLSNVIGSESKTYEYIIEAKSKDIDILKPDINISSKRYVVHNQKIYFPFSNIKSVGSVVSSQIVKARGDKEFTSIYDAMSRLVVGHVGEKTIEALIYAGCFDRFSYNKSTLIYNLDALMNYAKITVDIDPSLVMEPDIEVQEEFSEEFLLEKEKEYFGFYLSQHPTLRFRKDNPEVILLNDVSKYFSKTVRCVILVDKIKTIKTKKGDRMSFVSGSDETTSMDFTFFPKVWSEYNFIERGDILKVEGRVERRLDKYQIIVNRIKVLNEEGEKNEK